MPKDFCPICEHHHCICSTESDETIYPEDAIIDGLCDDCDLDPTQCLNEGRCRNG